MQGYAGTSPKIHLTDRGRSLRDVLIPEAVTVNADIGGRLRAPESRTLRRLLAKLTAAPAARP